ncbi:uncharacterized protein [Aegilops tauschii subsp. strangulata]|uniref:uncharacterized protein n=1 Tax=Aegilops tauschii subsp. strangulata TaxID=200361 RepID=UPI00098A2F38|nr:uncharacterized protein LOC109732748 [Aegilops tauschii subsp. strangulata]XP_044434150.1 uncharacterized protein LOC123160395 [Triticum aestivum]
MSGVEEKPEENLRSNLALTALSIVRNHQYLKELAMKQLTFPELVWSTDKNELAAMHKEKVEALTVHDPKRQALVAGRFCSFHLAGFDLDEKSSVELGPPYDPAVRKGTASTMNVISLRVVRVGPDYTYPVEVYGRVIARDEVDYKCVYLFDRQREDAQLINSEKDMSALTGPYRPLATRAFMCFELDLKIKDKGEQDAEVQLSKGVIPYHHNPYHKRVIDQLPSFQSTVKLVLQQVTGPVAASLEVSVVREGSDDPIVHFNGKITVGTTRNYRHHMVVYDSSVPIGRLVREDGSLVLSRNLVTVQGPIQDPAFADDEQMMLYVCFLDVGCEIEDEDMISLEPEDEDDDEIEPDKEEEEIEGEGEEEGNEEDSEEVDEEEEDPKNTVTLEYPTPETVWEHGSPKLKVKVDWTAIFDPPLEYYLTRWYALPKGFKSPNYRFGGFFE